MVQMNIFAKQKYTGIEYKLRVTKWGGDVG